MKFKAIAFAALFALSFTVAGATSVNSASQGITKVELTHGGKEKKDKKKKSKKHKCSDAEGTAKSNCHSGGSGCCAGKDKSEAKVQ